MLDLDRGVTKRRHRDGYVVAMYKGAPGRFLDVNGDEIDPKRAKEAGFDVDRLTIERRKREKLEAARSQIEQEFANRSDELDRLIDSGVEHFEVRHVGGGKYAIFDADSDTRMTNTPMSKAEAFNTMDELELPRVGDGEDDDSRGQGGEDDGLDDDEFPPE